ncbi:MAG: ATP-binding protein [Bacteroidales bacterium]|jgi:two-component sensor histidine kinase|nr:ATP-binding protein [Bacteroidales bacterium]
MENNSNKDIKKEFQEYYLHSSLSNIRIGLIFTILLFIVFAVLSRTFFSGAPGQDFFIRFGVIIPLLFFSVIITYSKKLSKYLNILYIIFNLLMCLVIFWVGYASNPSTPGYEFYYSWVMLVVIGLFTFFRLRFRSIIIIGALQVLSYIFTAVWNGTFQASPYQFFNNLFFILSIYSLGGLMSYILQNINWKNFLHQKALSSNYKKLLLESKERVTAETALRNSEIQLHDILDSIPDWIYVVDENFRFVMLNSSLKAEHLRQGFLEDCIGKKITKVYPFISKKTLEELEIVFKTGQILIGEQNFELIDKKIYGETRKVPIFRDHKVVQVVTILRDRSREQEVNELKIKNIEQKEIMLREIHHRVKNNLAIVISLLTLQLRNNKDPDLQRIIKDIEMRIRSMALIHEHLYRSENLDRIPLASYLNSLSSIILQTFSGHHIQLVSSFDQTDVSIETALPLGLITNELLTNAFKYAFPNHELGVIEVSLKKKNEEDYILTIKDNGVGMPSDFTLDNEKSLGMFIVKLLVEQLDGKIEIVNGQGTAFIIQFRNLMIAKKILI